MSRSRHEFDEVRKAQEEARTAVLPRLKAAGSKVSDAALSLWDEIGGFGDSALIALIYGVVTVYGSLVAGGYYDDATESLENRSARSFEKMGHLKNLNDPARGNETWLRRLDTISYRTASGGMGWNWTLFFNPKNWGVDVRRLMSAADRASIVMVPTVQDGRIATLTVGPSHGCLEMPWLWKDDKNAQAARALLGAFTARADGSQIVSGQYTYAPDGAVTYKPLPAGQTVEEICPVPPPPVPAKK